MADAGRGRALGQTSGANPGIFTFLIVTGGTLLGRAGCSAAPGKARSQAPVWR